MAPAPRFRVCSRLLVVLPLLSLAQTVLAQQKCYYPNGKESGEKPCSSAEGSACCPDKWQCLDNGLCYYEPTQLWGTYSCTDQTWQAAGCPSNLCTYNLTRIGGESMKQCPDHNNQWCCNGDDQKVQCCQGLPKPRPFFDLKDGTAYATAGGIEAAQAPILNTIIGEASGSPSTDDSSSPTPTNPVTSVRTSLSTGSTGIATIIVTSIISSPASSSTRTPPPVPASSPQSKLSIIIGCSLGIPLGLVLIAVLTWLFRTRSQQKAAKLRSQSQDPDLDSPNPYSNSGHADTVPFAAAAKIPPAYKSEVNVPELSGQSVGPGRPISMLKGRAELDSGADFAPGAATPHAPHLVGVGGGNSGIGSPRQKAMGGWASPPPGYSPNHNQAPWAWAQYQPDGPVEADSTPITAMPRTTGTTAGAGGYAPHQPSQAQQRGVLGNTPEMAEMSAVQSPPEFGDGFAAKEYGVGKSPV